MTLSCTIWQDNSSDIKFDGIMNSDNFGSKTTQLAGVVKEDKNLICW